MSRSIVTLISVFAFSLVSFTQTRAQNIGDEIFRHIADRLFDHAEWRYPEIFTSAESTQSISGSNNGETATWRWVYRYYPESDTYLAVNERELAVYVFGPKFGPDATRVGALTEVVSALGVEDPLGLAGSWVFQLTHRATPTSFDCGYKYYTWLSGSFPIDIFYDIERGTYVPEVGGLLTNTTPVKFLSTWEFEIADNDEGLQTDAVFILTALSSEFMTGTVRLTWEYGAWSVWGCDPLVWTVKAV